MSIDSKVAAVLDKRTDVHDLDSDDEEALFNELEDDVGGTDAFRERRLQQLHNEIAREKKMRVENQGTYAETMSEKEVLDLTTSRKYSIVHFFHPDFRRCKIMDSHLEVLARKHFDTLITRINVENCPFLVTKLNVQVLPCVICFIDGKGVDRVVGFENELGNSDGFATAALEGRFLKCGVFQRAKTTEDTKNKSIYGQTASQDFDDDDWD